MPRKRKPFIDKKTAVTFHLVHRSQRDPLIADGDAPKHVLVEKSSGSDPKSVHGGRHTLKPNEASKRKEEQRKYGVYFDDDYDYLQHLKDAGDVYLEPVEGFRIKRRCLASAPPDVENKQTKGQLSLPSSVFSSEIEDKIGVLNRAVPIRGPRPDLDPDVVEALESDFSDCEGSDGSFDDDFVLKANVEPSESDASDDYQSVSDGYSENDFEGDRSFDDEETKSRFTNYSMSSSVMRRNEGLTLIDDRFERIFEEYDEDQIGALDGEDIDGFLKPGDALLENVIEKFKKERAFSKLEDTKEKRADSAEKCSVEEKEEVEDDILNTSSEEEEEEDELEKMMIIEPTEKWDCESILSTYSTLYNHPKLIKEPPKPKPIKISVRTGIPLNVLNSSGLTADNLKALDLSTGVTHYTPPSERSVAVSVRVKGEAPEERRDRKRLVKEQRKERRIEKKANTLAFKEEKKRQEKVMVNLQQNFKGVKI